MTDPLVKDVLTRAEQLKAERGVFESHWEEIRRNLYPAASSFTSTDVVGAKNRTEIFDNTGEQAAEMLAAALVAGATNPAEPWFHLKALGYDAGTDHDAELWLEDTGRRLLDIFNSPSANFGPQQHEKYLDLVAFGSACMYVEDRPGNVPLFQARALSECFFAEGDVGRVDTNYRMFERTARQAVQRWGDKAGRNVVLAASNPKRQDDKFKFVHAVYPRHRRDPNRLDPANLPFASVWVNQDEQHLIDESGFHEFPYTCPRWAKRAGEVYGRGPGMKALADVKMLQRATKLQIRGVEKIIDPPLMVADDGVMSPVVLTSAGLNYVRADMMEDGKLPIRPLLTGGRPDVGDVFLDRVRNRVENAFYTHLIQFARDPQMTATQFLGITEQTHRAFAPIIERLQVEDCQPMIERLLGILLRLNPQNRAGVGYLLPLPAALLGKEIRVEYRSPITRLQKAGEVKAAVQGFEVFALFANAGSPEVYDNFDTDRMSRDIADIVGMRKAWVRSTQTVIEIRKARQQAAAQQAQADAAEQAADTAAAAGSGVKQFAEALAGAQPANRMAA